MTYKEILEKMVVSLNRASILKLALGMSPAASYKEILDAAKEKMGNTHKESQILIKMAEEWPAIRCVNELRVLVDKDLVDENSRLCERIAKLEKEVCRLPTREEWEAADKRSMEAMQYGSFGYRTGD